MVYEYANHLQERGYDIDILFINDNSLKKYHLPEPLRKVAVKYYTEYEPRWFELNPNIRKLSTTDSKIKSKLRSVDMAIATGVDTVKTTLEYFPNTKKIYFIQGYETWNCSEKAVIETYKLNMDKIVISNWLKTIVDKYSPQRAIVISNPIDTDAYKKYKSLDDRPNHSIGVLYHPGEYKGFTYSYEAILKLKSIYPDLTVKMFGTSKPPFEIPDCIDFYLNASKEETIEIYNSVSVFMCSSISEGFGLTGLEAMACGAVLVSSDYDGVREYAINDYNALLSTPKDVETMINNVKCVFDNHEQKLRLSVNGEKQAKVMGWDVAIDKFTRAIIGKQ